MEWNLKIKEKIILLFTACLILVFGSFLSYICFVMRPRTVLSTAAAISQLVESKADEVGSWVSKKVVEYRMISAIPAFTAMDTREILPLIDSFTNLYTRNGETMETFSYIGKNGFCWINSEATDQLMDYNDYRMAYSGDQEFLISEPTFNDNNREVLLFYYPVLGYGNQKEALICSAVPTVGLKEIVNANQLYHSKTWVMNRDHRLLTTDETYFYEHYLSGETLAAIDTRHMTEAGSFPVTTSPGASGTLFFSPIPHYPDWVLCTLVENSELSRSADEILRGCFLLFALLLSVTLLLGVVLTRSVMRPIRQLRERMDLVEHGNLDAYYDISATKDEIYDLGMAYNQMLDKISSLIETIYREQEEKRIAELMALQAQIKPHFLYNTLDNLKWMAKDHGAEDVAKTITSLSSFFRIFLSNGQEMIPLSEEMKHTRCYLEIQAVRYQEKLSWSLTFEDALQSVPTVKIITQPVVENAIYHGIKPKEGKGTVAIHARQDEGFVVITVQDDGVGMEPETLSALQKRLNTLDLKEHFGMGNTLQRLKAVYGEKAGLTISSIPGVGTIVTIYFPIETEESHVSGNCS